MGRTDSTITKEKILASAERLFAEKGYSGAGIDEISREAGTNKALIYYHFKNKEGLLNALNDRIMEEVKVLVGRSFAGAEKQSREEVAEALKDIIGFLKENRALLKILLMESLKGGAREEVLMELARSLIMGELKEMKKLSDFKTEEESFLVYEFFTGFLPIYNFALFSEGFSSYFEQDEESLENYFIDSFIRSHLSHHNF
ncbi:MAG: TetR/AcrR family transcriptional regulator [Spirochaetales bacterium]|nr:TetR/AcrR family transcriptional regulator [Spirochaetales bacterium]